MGDGAIYRSCTLYAAHRVGVLSMALMALLIPADGALGQAVTLDERFHDAGQVEQFVTNRGMFNFRGIPGYGSEQNTEYPAGSLVDHMGDLGFLIGGIPEGGESEGDTLVSVSNAFGDAPVGIYYHHDFTGYSDEPWDTIWVAERGDELDIPYDVPYPDDTYHLPGNGPYIPVSDQDFVTRYNDYNVFVRQTGQRHEPLYLDVVQTSYAWSSPPLDNIIMARFTVKATRHGVRDAFVALFVDPNIGYRPADVEAGQILGDDYSRYVEEMKMGVGVDVEGGQDARDEGPYSVVGTILFADENTHRDDDLTWRFKVGGTGGERALPTTDPEIYETISTGSSDPSQHEDLAVGNTHYVLSVGPFDLPQDSTYSFTMALVLADEEDLMEEARLAYFAYERDFKLPQPPPAPPLKVDVSSGQVHLDWEARAGDVNPETYTDPNRGDAADQPFEGYRLYKSTQGRTGPWTLLGVYDIADNGFGPSDAGLRRSYTDRNLIDNVEYFYSVTAFSKRDTTVGEEGWPSQESSVAANAVTVVPGPGRSETVTEVAVVPNPYRGDIRYQDYNPPWEKPPPSRERWLEQDRRLTFINLPGPCTIEVYTLSGTLVQTIEHRSTHQNFAEWNLTSLADQAIASGIYLFTVRENATGEVHVGKFVVIK